MATPPGRRDACALKRYLVNIGHQEYPVHLHDDGRIEIAGSDTTIDAQRVSSTEFTVLIGARCIRVAAITENGKISAWADGKMYAPVVESDRERMLRKYSRATGETRTKKELHAPMPALVVRIEVNVGDSVEAGQGLIILEAMKMENELRADVSGRVKQIHVSPGKPVEKGELLLVIE
jgi:pyruvate carboxylase subunit B